MYVCIYMHMHTHMHTHTHRETYLYFTYHIHIPQALIIYVYTFMCVCVSICNIIEYTRQGYIHACYMCMSSCMYMPLPRLGERHADGNSAKGKRGLIRGNVYRIVVSRVYSRGEIETTRVPTQPAWFLSSAGEAGSQTASIQPNV